MWEETIVLTAVITGVVLKLNSVSCVIVTKKLRNRIHQLTNGVLCLYLTDIFLLITFHIPIPFLHDNCNSGIVFSLLIITIVIMELISGLGQWKLDEKDVNQQMINFLTIGTCIFWLMTEIMGLLLKVKS